MKESWTYGVGEDDREDGGIGRDRRPLNGVGSLWANQVSSLIITMLWDSPYLDGPKVSIPGRGDGDGLDSGSKDGEWNEDGGETHFVVCVLGWW